MTARPILFSAPMIRALLDGRKTQTRRIVKPQPEKRHVCGVDPMLGFKKRGSRDLWLYPNAKQEVLATCPYGQPGDTLWVRETWRELEYPTMSTTHEYRATSRDSENHKWRPSIYMPRWVSRITLVISSVRVQRLQEISEADARAEGAPLELRLLDSVRLGATASHTGGFERLWESIYGPDSWDANPWVWALTFEVIRKNVDKVTA